MVTKVLEQRCVHNWMIASPNGSSSPGECAKCGERRWFANSFPDLERTNNSDLFSERGGRRSARGGDGYAESSSDLDIEVALSSMRSYRGRYH